MTGSAPATGDGGPAAGRQVRHRDLVVGFDLDLTLIDSRQGIAEVLRALAAETGVNMDVDLVTSRLGPPLEVELAEWFPAADVPAMARRYRQMYRSWAIERTPLLPGAAEAVDAVRAAGGRVIIVTSKHESNARAHLEHTGLIVDDLVGLAYRDGKRDALLRHRARWYVGDHVADMRSARAAAELAPELGIIGVGVTTGSCTARQLADAGADMVLPDLFGLPALLTRGPRDENPFSSSVDVSITSRHA